MLLGCFILGYLTYIPDSYVERVQCLNCNIYIIICKLTTTRFLIDKLTLKKIPHMAFLN